MNEKEFDVVVIGAGPAGEVAAGRVADFAKDKLSIAIVESHLVGGECSFYACMPSKALLRPGELLEEVQRVPGASEAVTGKLDVAAVLKRRDEVIHDLDDSIQLPWLESRDITVIRGYGKLDGDKQVRVGDDLIQARKAVVVAVGSGALLPPIPGLKEAKPWTNREITTAKSAPEHLVILGGGVVGAEMAQAWSTLGSKVSLIEALPRILPRVEPFASEQVTEALKEQGVDVYTGTKATEVSRDGDQVTVTLENGEKISGSELLAAIGRKPLTDDIGLETVGLEAGKIIEVDDHMRVPGHDWLYAVGDANGRSLLTHMGKYQARVAADNILGKDEIVEDHGPVSPQVIFTSPQVATVGHTLDSAEVAGLNVSVVDYPTGGTAGASFYGRNATGTVRFLIDEDNKVLVGATFTGPDIADFLHAATIAVVGEVPLDRLWNAVPSFPTRSEVWLRLFETYGL